MLLRVLLICGWSIVLTKVMAQDDWSTSQSVTEQVDGSEWINEGLDVHLHLSSTCFSLDEKKQITQFFRSVPFVTYQQIQGIQSLRRETIRCFLQSINASLPTLRRRGEWDEKTRITSIIKPQDDGIYTLLKCKAPIGRSWRSGFLFEKDATEAWWTKSGPDYSSGYLEYTPQQGSLKKLILGDYRIRLGQGLIHNNFFRRGLFFRHDHLPVLTGKRSMPYHSLDENRGLRGISSEWKTNSWEHLGFLSYRQRDANIDSTRNEVASLPLSGIHSTASEIRNKDQMKEASLGLQSKYQGRYYSLSFHQLLRWKSHQWQKGLRIDQIWRRSNLIDQWTGLSYKIELKNLFVFGETALQSSMNWAHLHGIIWSPQRRHLFHIQYRWISPQYYSHSAQSFIQSSQVNNERGVFFGYSWKPNRAWNLYSNIGQFTYPYWSYLQSPFRSGSNWLNGVQYEKRRRYSLRLQWRYIQRNQRALSPYKEIGHNLRLHYTQTLAPGLEWRSRIEWSLRKLGHQNHQGWLTYQEIKWSPWESPWSGVFRITVHQTSGFESRIYAYQHALGGVFRIPAYFGKSASAYTLIKYKWRKFQYQLRGQINGTGNQVEFNWGLGMKGGF